MWKVFLFLMAVIFFSISNICCSSAIDRQRETAIQKLNSDSWVEREKGVFELRDIKLDSRVKRLLLEVLRKEFHVIESGAAMPPDNEYGDYIVILSNLIAANKVPESFSLLFSLICTGKLNLSPALLLHYGEGALDFLMDKARKGSTMESEIALAALAVWVEPQSNLYAEDYEPAQVMPLNDSRREDIMRLMLEASFSKDYNVRSMSIEGLESFLTNDQVRRRMVEILEQDSKATIRKRAKEILSRYQTGK